MLVLCVAIILIAAAVMLPRQKVVGVAQSVSPPAFCAVVGDEAVTSLLVPIRQKFDIPAIAAVVLTSAGIQGVGAVGVRKRGAEIPVALNDHWHLGSDGK